MADCKYFFEELFSKERRFLSEDSCIIGDVAVCYSIDGGIVLESDLEEEIEMMREAMMGAADKEGLIADETLELSRKLDSLMNQFDKRKDLS